MSLRRASFAAILVVVASATGCETSCETECDDQYDECLETAPPGASSADCSEEHRECLQRCGTALDV